MSFLRNLGIYVIFCLMLLSSCNSSDNVRQEIIYLRSVQDSLCREIMELRMEQTSLKTRFLLEPRLPHTQPDTKPVWKDCYVPLAESSNLPTLEHLK